MADSQSIRITGDKALIAKLKELQSQKLLKKSEVTKALRPSAKMYQAKARALCPKDTGSLRRSIRIKTANGKRPALLVMPEYRQRVSKKTGKQTSAGYHGHLVEFGTTMRRLAKPHRAPLSNGVRFVTHTGYMPARPFLRPAWNATRAAMRETIRQNLWALVRAKAVAA